jgi:NAD(P)-dependent dehydrogenase (short-subunit alcohol dehydrogenase family)
VLNLEHGCPEPAQMGQNVGPNVTATALVTGGAHGIGWACASRLAEEGARVAVTDLDQDAARQVAKGLTDEARRHLAVRLDVTDVSSVEQAFADAASGLGGIDSTNALTALGSEPYSSAKAGIGSLTINLAASLAPDGIRVNAVAPATIRPGAGTDKMAERIASATSTRSDASASPRTSPPQSRSWRQAMRPGSPDTHSQWTAGS